MATLAQIAANRVNALKSTGPKTPAGRQRSSRNAVKWGLFSQHVVLTDQDAREWEELSSRIRALLRPADPIEEMLVDEVIANWFRLSRCLRIDGGLFRAFSTYQGRACGLGTAFAQAARLDCFGKLSRYEQHLERKLALSLQRLQSARRLRSGAAPASAPELPESALLTVPQEETMTAAGGSAELDSTRDLHTAQGRWRAIFVGVVEWFQQPARRCKRPEAQRQEDNLRSKP